MKYSDYLNALPNTRPVKQTVTVRDENREAILEQQIVSLKEQLTKHTDQLKTIDELKRKNGVLNRDRQEYSSKLDSSTASLIKVNSQLENQTKLVNDIKSVKQQLDSKEESFTNLHIKSVEQQRELTKQQDEIVNLTIDKHLLEENQVHLQRQTTYAEQKHEDITGEIKFVKRKFAELGSVSEAMTEQYNKIQQELNGRVDQCTLLRTTIQMLEEEIATVNGSNSSLHESLNSLQDFYVNTKDELNYSETESNKLESSLESLLTTLQNVENENRYLMDKQHHLEVALSKPKYISESSIARREGFRIPLASAALNMQKNYLGTGKPTLLKFRTKESTNDNS